MDAQLTKRSPTCKKQTGGRQVGCVVPLHRELAVGTLRGVLRQAKVAPDEFMENLYRPNVAGPAGEHRDAPYSLEREIQTTVCWSAYG